MKIFKISSIHFKSRIIDSHVHIGKHDGQICQKTNLDDFVKTTLPNNDNVEKMLVSDLDVLHGEKDEFFGNYEALKIFEKDSKYNLLASCNPLNGKVENIQKLYNYNPTSFIGLKFHPTIQKLCVNDSKYDPYLNFANKNNIPCLFHSSVLTDKNGKLSEKIEPYSDPELIYQTAKKYPKTPFVIAHLGAGWKEAHDKTINIILDSIIKGDANLYADISWVDIDAKNEEGKPTKEHIIKAIKMLKGIDNPNWDFGDQSFRLLFGSDAPLARFHTEEHKNAIKNYTRFIDEIKSAIRNDKDLKSEAEKIIENLFYNNSKKLYFSNKKFISKL